MIIDQLFKKNYILKMDTVILFLQTLLFENQLQYKAML